MMPEYSGFRRKSFLERHMEGLKAALLLFFLLLLILSAVNFLQVGGKVATDEVPHLEFNRTVQVTPDEKFLTGSFARINYVPSTDRFAVTFGTKGQRIQQECNGTGYAYKEYTTDMAYTGKSGYLISYPPTSCEAGDSGSTMVGDAYYLVTMPQDSRSTNDLMITKFNASDWSISAETFFTLNLPYESGLDPCVAFVNGQLDVSDQYNPKGMWQDGYDSYHNLFSANLEPQGKKILSDSPHISGASMIFADGSYYIISANSYDGDLVVLKYDANWKYLGTKNLTKRANWAQGVAFDGNFFYLAYLDTSQSADPPRFFPVYPNVHLAVYDREWNLIEDTAVTNFKVSDNKKAGRPWVMLHNNQVYVSYDVDTVDPATLEEELKWQAYVTIYDK